MGEFGDEQVSILKGISEFSLLFEEVYIILLVSLDGLALFYL